MKLLMTLLFLSALLGAEDQQPPALGSGNRAEVLAKLEQKEQVALAQAGALALRFTQTSFGQAYRDNLKACKIDMEFQSVEVLTAGATATGLGFLARSFVRSHYELSGIALKETAQAARIYASRLVSLPAASPSIPVKLLMLPLVIGGAIAAWDIYVADEVCERTAAEEAFKQTRDKDAYHAWEKLAQVMEIAAKARAEIDRMN